MKMTQSFVEKLNQAIQKNQSLLCLGLDPEISKIPPTVEGASDIERMKKWCTDLIEKVSGLICCIKPNLAFFEQYGAEGYRALKEILQQVPPDIPVLMDAKRGDIGSTAEAHARAIFDYWKADAVTVNPYLGRDSIAPFLKYPGKMVFVLCKTSNPSAGELQDHGVPALYQQVLEAAKNWGNEEQIGFVVGATQPDSLAEVRMLVLDHWILAPGIGAQGGDLRQALEAGLTASRSGLIFPVSRSVMLADDPTAAARQLRDQINEYRNSRTVAKRPREEWEKVELVRNLFQAQCVQFGEFTLASGKKSLVYVDLRRIMSYPRVFAKCVEACVSAAAGIKYDSLAAVPYAALPITGGAAMQLKVPMIYARKEAKSHGTGKMIEGDYSKGDTALLIEDVVTTGGSIITAAQTLRDGGLQVNDVIVLVDRLQGGKKALREEKIYLHAVLTIKEMVEILHDEKKINENIYREVKMYLDGNCVEN